MSFVEDSTTQFNRAGSPSVLVEHGQFIDPVTGTDVHPDIMNDIIQYVLSLHPTTDDQAPSIVDPPITSPEEPTPISQNPYFGWTTWKPAPSSQALATAPSSSSHWTGADSYEGFWSKLRNPLYFAQLNANEQAKLQLPDSPALPHDNFAPAGSQFPFTNTAAPCEIFGPLHNPKPSPKAPIAPDVSQKSSLKRERSLVYTQEDLAEKYPSFTHSIKVIPQRIEESFVCNRFGCGAVVNGTASAIIKHGKEHLHVNHMSKINCIYEKCPSKVVITDLGKHVEAHLQHDGARCGVCGDWFATSELATNHLTQPCPVLVSRGNAEGCPPPSKKAKH